MMLDVGSVRREGRWVRLFGLVGVVVVEVGGPLGDGPREGVVETDGPSPSRSSSTNWRSYGM